MPGLLGGLALAGGNVALQHLLDRSAQRKADKKQAKRIAQQNLVGSLDPQTRAPQVPQLQAAPGIASSLLNDPQVRALLQELLMGSAGRSAGNAGLNVFDQIG